MLLCYLMFCHVVLILMALCFRDAEFSLTLIFFSIELAVCICGSCLRVSILYGLGCTFISISRRMSPLNYINNGKTKNKINN